MIPISVLIPLYNAEKFLNETIDSVLCQTFSNFELLLMDDGSTDNTASVVSSYKDSRIRYECLPHSFVDTLNHGIDKARGKYIALLDHDDIMTPDRLQKQYAFMEAHLEVAACGAWMQSFGNVCKHWESVLIYPDIILELLGRKKIFMCNPTGFIRKDVLDHFNIRYKKGYAFHADIKFWSDLLKVGKVENLKEILVWYRTSDTQASTIAKTESQKAAIEIFNEYFNFLISKLDDNEEIKSRFQNEFLPALKIMTDLSFFSVYSYFQFLKQVIEGLYNNGFLNLDYPLEKKPLS